MTLQDPEMPATDVWLAYCPAWLSDGTKWPQRG